MTPVLMIVTSLSKVTMVSEEVTIVIDQVLTYSRQLNARIEGVQDSPCRLRESMHTELSWCSTAQIRQLEPLHTISETTTREPVYLADEEVDISSLHMSQGGL